MYCLTTCINVTNYPSHINVGMSFKSESFGIIKFGIHRTSDGHIISRSGRRVYSFGSVVTVNLRLNLAVHFAQRHQLINGSRFDSINRTSAEMGGRRTNDPENRVQNEAGPCVNYRRHTSVVRHSELNFRYLHHRV